MSLPYRPALLAEAIESEPCDYYCGPLNHPTTAYCIDVDGQTIVGERVAVRFDETSIWIAGHQRTLRIKRGTQFGQFHNIRRLVEVHRPKLAAASKSGRPGTVPADAIAVAGRQVGDLQNRALFVWFSCTANPGTGTIDCAKWYPNGDSKGIERYCARTMDGAVVLPNFRIDPLASKEGQLVLSSGALLLFDHRGRTNEDLADPGEACR